MLKTAIAILFALGLTSPPIQDPPALSNATLKSMLDNLGFETKSVDGEFVVTVTQGAWIDAIRFRISSDKSKIGLNSSLSVIPDLAIVPAAKWQKLLADNLDINPSFISLDEKNKVLVMSRVLDNRAISPAYLRKQIDRFCATVHSTADDWQMK